MRQFVLLLWLPLLVGGEHASVHRKGNSWLLVTDKVERRVVLQAGHLRTTSWKDKVSGRELLPTVLAESEFATTVDDSGWELASATSRKLSQGEVQFDLVLRRGPLEVTRCFVLYPGSSIIREWSSFKNIGTVDLEMRDPRFLRHTLQLGRSTQFYWMRGGENRAGSWTLQTETLVPGRPREFDSYDPFGGTADGNFLGDGVQVQVLHNRNVVWPPPGGQPRSWDYVANADSPVRIDCDLEVAVGDSVAFILNRWRNNRYDSTAFDPTVRYEDGETYVASREFGSRQGAGGWRYQYREADKFADLSYDGAAKQWRVPGAEEDLFIAAAEQLPGSLRDAVRLWTAPKAGKVRVLAEVVNHANRAVPGAGRSFRMGSSSYAPWNALLDPETGQGVFIGWDYFGHWASRFYAGPDGVFRFEFHVAGHRQMLRPGESLTVPQAFVGLFQEDLDNAGNECLDWQYRYLWDYTREGWFPAIRMLGWWWNGTPWRDPGNTWVGGNGDQGSAFRKVFRVVDLMSQVGADVYHRDWGWWDRAGDWGGPDFKTTGEYLRKRGMGQLIYAFIYTVDAQSRVAREHPEWVINQTLDMSQPKAVEHLKYQLDDFARRFGPFEWRNDSTPTVPHGSDDTPLLRQDQSFRQILRNFLDKHPDCAFQAVNGGGNNAGYDYARYASAVSFSDGAVGIVRNYWASLILPPDKSSDIPDIWQPNQYDKAIWRGLLTMNFDMTGDTWDPVKVEGLRELIDIYHYLHKQGVVGRWVKVYRPVVIGDDPRMYFQRLSSDRRRSILIPKRRAPGAVVIRPKGLTAGAEYLVSFQESDGSETRTGADLMERGIQVENMAPGELIYLNLPYHPGSRRYRTAPLAPRTARKQWASYLGYPGVELTWGAGTDDHWVSYYEVSRDGTVIDKVAKGTFYFDHSAGADIAARYEIRTVNGGGLRSPATAAQGPDAQRAQILDDASTAIAYSGAWQQETDLPPAHAGTIRSSNDKGATFEFLMEGSKFTWFTRLCNECGKAEVIVDGLREAVVDTYSADDIWGVGVCSKSFDRPGRRRIRIMVTGEHGGPRGKDTRVYLDGIRIE